LALLYEAETRSVSPLEVVAELPLAPDPYAVELVEGIAGHVDELDLAIRGHATGWAPERMPVLDRLILVIAAFELLHRPDVPRAVAIDEAIEMAKAYSTEDSARFVNGVLAALASEVDHEPA
jgi:N utilization substance protein B